MVHDGLIVPADIAVSEDIARILFSPSMLEDGRIAPSAFFLCDLPNGPESYISVWRSTYQRPSPENVTFKARKAGDSLAGYALISVSDCLATCHGDYTTEVRPHPNPKLPVHAGIHISKGVIPVKGACYEPGYVMLATMIAHKCSLILF